MGKEVLKLFYDSYMDYVFKVNFFFNLFFKVGGGEGAVEI